MKQINFFIFFILISINCSFADINKEFEVWKLNFKKKALENNTKVVVKEVSKSVLKVIMMAKLEQILNLG